MIKLLLILSQFATLMVLMQFIDMNKLHNHNVGKSFNNLH